MVCELTCTFIKKSLDAAKAGDYMKALSILIKAKDCQCEEPEVQLYIHLALDEFIEQDYDTAMMILRDAVEYCNQIKD